MNYPKVGIIYLCWADEPVKYLCEALDAIARQTYPKDKICLHIVYNGPAKDGESQASFIERVLNEKKDLLPCSYFYNSQSNIGFSAGNNLGMRQAVAKGADYVFLHNPDGYLASDTIEKLVMAMEKDCQIGVCQPLIMLYPETDLINSAGNKLHYLMVGYCDKYREKLSTKKLASEIGYASGAAAFMRADLINNFGLWNERFFLYHEDTEYSLRLRLLGYKINLVSDTVFYHKYHFSNKPNKFFWIERNRHALKLMYYRWPTLVLLLPIEILFNFGLIIASVFGGWCKELFKAYGYWFRVNNWNEWLHERNIIQRKRRINDRQLLKYSTSFISPGDFKIMMPVKILVNLVFTFYNYLLKIIIWW